MGGLLIDVPIEWFGCCIDLTAEKWEVETEQRRFRQANTRPPELRPELEVKPPAAANGQGAAEAAKGAEVVPLTSRERRTHAKGH